MRASSDDALKENKPLNKTKQNLINSADYQLEMLCKNKPLTLPDNAPPCAKEHGLEFEQHMDQLILDRDKNMSAASCRSLLRDDQKVCKDPYYGFTPDTLGGGVNWPTKATKSVRSYHNHKIVIIMRTVSIPEIVWSILGLALQMLRV